MTRLECASRRTFWLQAQTIADLQTDAMRREYMLALPIASRRALGVAAKALIAERG